MKDKLYYCYILTNKNRTVLYIGYTEDLKHRLEQHQNGSGTNFTKKYNVTHLIYLEDFTDKKEAKKREKQLKNWRKEWKWNLIKENNPLLEAIELN